MIYLISVVITLTRIGLLELTISFIYAAAISETFYVVGIYEEPVNALWRHWPYKDRKNGLGFFFFLFFPPAFGHVTTRPLFLDKSVNLTLLLFFSISFLFVYKYDRTVLDMLMLYLIYVWSVGTIRCFCELLVYVIIRNSGERESHKWILSGNLKHAPFDLYGTYPGNSTRKITSCAEFPSHRATAIKLNSGKWYLNMLESYSSSLSVKGTYLLIYRTFFPL